MSGDIHISNCKPDTESPCASAGKGECFVWYNDEKKDDRTVSFAPKTPDLFGEGQKPPADILIHAGDSQKRCLAKGVTPGKYFYRLNECDKSDFRGHPHVIIVSQ